MDAYQLGIERLIQRVRQLAEPWSPTPIKKEIDSLAKRLQALAEDLSVDGVAQFSIECEHDREPETETGVDGWPIEPVSFDIRYAGIVHHIKLLAESAKRASSNLPNSRMRHALPFAALGLLYLRHEHDFAPAALSDNSLDVKELERVCNAAGIVLSRESYRNALSDALQKFDVHYVPFEYRRIVRGG